LGDLALDKVAVKLSTTVQKNNFSVEVNPFINSISNFFFALGFETTIRGVPGLGIPTNQCKISVEYRLIGK
jgi:hypothetical protein